jgi:hypothetical protein
MHPLNKWAVQGILFVLLLSGCSTTATPGETETPPFSPGASISATAIPSPTLIPTAALTATPTSRPYQLRPGELELAASPDDIPAIFANDNLFVSAEDGNAEWRDDEDVIGLEFNGDARAYPIRLLSLHEIVNDTVGGEPVAITWCPLCYSAIVFKRVADRELTFGVSGFLFKNNLVMYDHQSDTLWSQILGEGIKGAYSGRRLEILPSILTTWGAWKQSHPETRVLSAVQMGNQSNQIVDPYVGYYSSGAAGLGGQATLDERLPAKELVVGLRVGDEKRAYPLALLREIDIVNDELSGLPIVLIYDEELLTVFVYERIIKDTERTFVLESTPGLMRDQEPGSLWDVQTGLATEGPLAGTRLIRLSAPLVFWFAWSDIYPDTEVYSR